jgi:hypothetical protein
MAEAPTLRQRLRAMRLDVLAQLAAADKVEAGFLSLLAGADAVLRLLDDAAAAPPVNAMAASRVAILDDGEAIRLVIYAAADRVATVDLSPQRAAQLGNQLAAAALRRWPRPAT